MAISRNKIYEMTKQLDKDYEEMLRKNFEGNKVRVVKEYLARKYPVSTKEVDELFNEALQIARSIDDADKSALALRYIASKLAKIDVNRALQVARSIDDAIWRARALSNIAVELAKVDMDRALNIFNEALQIARSIDDADKRVWTLSNIAVELAKVDVDRALNIFNEALQIARSIDDADKRVWTLSNIASKLAKIDVNRALQVARSIDKANWRAWVLSDGAVELAKVDVDRALNIFNEALQVARSIDGAYLRACALSNIAGELAKIDVNRAMNVFNEALQTARCIDDAFFRASTLSDIASNLAKIDVNRALQVARSIDDADERALALRDIAVELAKVDVNRALQVARSIDDAIWRARALSNIAVELTKVDVNRALQVARSIDDAIWRARALSNIAVELAKTLSKKALDSIPDELVLRIVDENWSDSKIREFLRNIVRQLEIKQEWEEIAARQRIAGLNVPEMPQEYKRLKDDFENLRGLSANARVSVNFQREIIVNRWSKGEIVVKNEGDINVEDVEIEVQSDVVEVRGLKKVKILKRGESKKIPVRIKSKDAGYVPVEIKIKYRNPLSEKEEERVIYPEIYVKKEAREKVMPTTTAAAAGAHIPLNRVKRIYGIKGEKEKKYKWGELSVYDIVKKIGSGGFSDVYLVEKEGRKYAMKIPKGVDLRGDDTIVLSEKDLEQYGKEAEIWAMLTEKVPDAVINLIDAGIHPFPWFVMELGDKSLKDAVNGLSYEEKIKLAMDLLSKLDKIHHFGVVHKDIKPENVLHAGGEWKFTDFGLSKIVNRSCKSSQSGTLLYMAPEQISKKKFGGTDWRTDIWQMGVMIYELLTGHLPFEAEDVWEITGMILRDEPVPATEYGLSKEVWRVIEKALRKDKEKRWQSAAEMKRELEVIL